MSRVLPLNGVRVLNTLRFGTAVGGLDTASADHYAEEMDDDHCC
jgi:hypothetical protein